MRGKHAEPGAAADLVDLVEEVGNVKPQLHPLQENSVDRLDDAEIHLLIAGQGRPGRGPAREGGPETAAGGEIDGKSGVMERKRILDAGRGCVGLVVIVWMALVAIKARSSGEKLN